MVAPVLPTKSAAMRVQLGLPPLAAAVDRDQWPRTGLAHRGATLGAGLPPLPDVRQGRRAGDAREARAAPGRTFAPLEGAPRTAPAPAIAPAKPAPDATAAPPASISYDQFSTVDLRVGLVRTCERIPKKDKLLRLTVDIGEAEPRLIVAGLAQTFAPEALVGVRVVVVANLAPARLRKGARLARDDPRDRPERRAPARERRRRRRPRVTPQVGGRDRARPDHSRAATRATTASMLAPSNGFSSTGRPVASTRSCISSSPLP